MNIIEKEYPEFHEEIKYIAGIRAMKNFEAEKTLNKTIVLSKMKKKVDK